MFAFLLFATVQAPGADIVVTGTRLDDAYAECVARHCSPLRDAQVSIAWAERAFRRGDYLAAKRGLAAAVARNRSAAAVAPRPVAALYEAYGTVTLQEGDLDAYRGAVGAQMRTLRDNLPASDPAVSNAELALGDMWVKQGDTRNAQAAYERAQQLATTHGLNITVLNAGFRLVSLANARGRHVEASRLLENIARSPAAQNAEVQSIIPAFRLRLAVGRADKVEVDRQIAAVARSSSNLRPVLISNPPFEPVAATAAQEHADKFGGVNPFAMRSTDGSELKWADIGYWIRPDGRTAEASILRSAGDESWTTASLNQIAARRYAMSAGDNAGQGVYRIERHTLRGSGYGIPTGSLIRRRMGPMRVEVLDITSVPDVPSTPGS